MDHLVLLGDSIFDNGAYVDRGPAVIDQVRQRLPEGASASLLAVDGSVIADIHQQLERLPEDASHLVLSVGGNDILNDIGLLGVAVRTVGEGIGKLAELRDRVLHDYHTLMRTLRARDLPTLVCTIYEPNFPDAKLQREAVTALCLFNDAIIREAHAHRFHILDLRAVCMSEHDYANPIEPSSIGGDKIAEALLGAIERTAGSSVGTMILPALPSGHAGIQREAAPRRGHTI